MMVATRPPRAIRWMLSGSHPRDACSGAGRCRLRHVCHGVRYLRGAKALRHSITAHSAKSDRSLSRRNLQHYQIQKTTRD